ncbi:MAG: hypothetical protein E7262_11275 [Lachnospiraceae bacterium]|nr:hypothetical protein [Lachnospiraceae bacterium]
MVTDWVMCLLTAIYVIATIMILCANAKSAKVSSDQLNESITTQKQNVALELLNRRIEIYSILTKWVNHAKCICGGEKHFRETLKFLRALLFNNIEDVDLYEKNKIVENLVMTLNNKIHINNDTITQLEKQIFDLNQEIFMTKISRLEKERCILESAEIVYDIDDEKLNTFISAYIEMAFNINNELEADDKYVYANALKKATLKIVDSDMLKQMKVEMKKDLKTNKCKII